MEFSSRPQAAETQLPRYRFVSGCRTAFSERQNDSQTEIFAVYKIDRQLNRHHNRYGGKLHNNGLMIFKPFNLGDLTFQITFRYDDRIIDLQVRHNFHFVSLR